MMKPIYMLLFAFMLLTLFSCDNEDDQVLEEPMFDNYSEYIEFIYSREWMFGIEIDNKEENTAELYIINSQVELSMDDVISLTINGESVGTELNFHDEGVWLDCDSVEIPPDRKFNIVFLYNGETVFNNTALIPLAPNILNVDISTPDKPINVSWQLMSDTSLQFAEVWINNLLIKHLFLSGSARSFTLAANTFNVEEFIDWGIELHTVCIAQFENSAVMANNHSYQGNDSRLNTCDERHSFSHFKR